MGAYYRWRPHPWHGLQPGPEPPRVVTAYIEITPYDSVKYEIDKETGYLRVDRPQRYSSQTPALYGFIPQTYCGEGVSALSKDATQGDGDPLDICVLCERPINRAEILLNARVIGGLRMVDNDEADDKIIAVLENDQVYGAMREISDVPEVLVERLRHYFGTYKMKPGEESKMKFAGMYGRAEAEQVVLASMDDYDDHFARLERR